jgi:D-proline reductase (dithiol) PrdB
MATLSDLKLTYRLYMKGYIYRSHDWRPGAVLQKPLSEARIACVTTASYTLPSQEPFDEKVRGGDFSYRVIPSDADLSTLQISHRSDAFDPDGLLADYNVALPVDRLREMAEAGEIGAVAGKHYSFQGSIPAPGRLVKMTAPEVAGQLAADGVDGVILTPV